MEIVVEKIVEQILPLLGGLEWKFILGMILVNTLWQELEEKLKWKYLAKVKKRLKVALLGLLYAPLHYFLFGLKEDEIGILFLSFLVTFAFHKLLAEEVIKKLKEALPKKAIVEDKIETDE